MIFGFLLQKGGVAKYYVLIGVLLLRDFTVMKIMLSAVLVGMVGVYTLRYLGLAKLRVKPTRYAAHVIGGLLFGIGVALAAYCPGAGTAALGQGILDARAVVLGLVAGAYVFAGMSHGSPGRSTLSVSAGKLPGHSSCLGNLPVISGFAAVIVAALAIFWKAHPSAVRLLGSPAGRLVRT